MVYMQDGMRDIVQQGTQLDAVVMMFLAAMSAITFYNVFAAVATGADACILVEQLSGHNQFFLIGAQKYKPGTVIYSQLGMNCGKEWMN